MITKPLSFKAFYWRVVYKIFTKRFKGVSWFELLYEIPEETHDKERGD